jgi:ATP-dependent RNA helicase SUPV3L1/SUV3
LTRLAKTAGDVDALAQRLAYVRTWSYAAHRKDWTKDPEYWTSRTREVEDQLSDALHERLTARFIDRRTSALMKGLREKTDLQSGLNSLGEVTVEGHFVGRLNGLSFEADAAGEPLARRAVANAAMKAVRPEVNRLLSQLSQADDAELALGEDGLLNWKDDPVGRLKAGGDPFTPGVDLIGGELGSSELIAQAEKRLMTFAAEQAGTRLEPLLAMRKALKEEGRLDGLARGVAYQLVENFGAMSRAKLADELSALSVPERQSLRRAGVRIGEHAVFMPALLKPGAARLLSMLKAVHEGDIERAVNPPPGLTSIPNDRRYTLADYAAAGFQPCGPRAVRLDMLERLADLIRDQRSENKERRFEPNAPMTALLGCSNEDLREVLKALGYRRVQTATEEQAELWAGRSRSSTVRRKAETSLMARARARARMCAPQSLRLCRTSRSTRIRPSPRSPRWSWSNPNPPPRNAASRARSPKPNLLKRARPKPSLSQKACRRLRLRPIRQRRNRPQKRPRQTLKPHQTRRRHHKSAHERTRPSSALRCLAFPDAAFQIARPGGADGRERRCPN